jgi:hypothetical protein
MLSVHAAHRIYTREPANKIRTGVGKFGVPSKKFLKTLPNIPFFFVNGNISRHGRQIGFLKRHNPKSPPAAQNV